MTVDELRKLKDKGPYDITLEYRISLYDNMPYERDINICNRENLHNGNLIKYYRCKAAEVFIISPNTLEVV